MWEHDTEADTEADTGADTEPTSRPQELRRHMNDLTAQRPAVTRVEVIDTIANAFDHAPLTRGQLIRAAEDAAAPRPVVELLEQLPERAYRRPADLWDELPDVPIEQLTPEPRLHAEPPAPTAERGRH